MSRKIDDAGEIIKGARKFIGKRALNPEDIDLMNVDEAVEMINKDAVWPKPDYQEMIDGGVEPIAAALIKIIRDRMAAKPNFNIYEYGTRELRKPMKVAADFLTMTAIVRDSVAGIRTQADAQALSSTITESIGWNTNWRDNETRHLLWSIYKGRKNPLSVTYSDLSKAAKMVTDGFPAKVPAWRKKYDLRKGHDGSFYVTRGYQILQDNFASREEALKWMEENLAEKAISRKPQEKMPKRPHLKNIVREAETDHRNGRDIDPQEFIDTFGFRGVQFGEWLPDDERQDVLNHAHDAMMDLAEVLDVEPEHLSLGGTLAIAFGARGRGRAAAHYEPGERVLNLTRLSGAGSLAHEFAHALDHWAGRDPEGLAPDHPGGVPSATGWMEHRPKRTEYLTHLSDGAAQAWEFLMHALIKRTLTAEEYGQELRTKIEKYETYIDKLDKRIADALPEEKEPLEYRKRAYSESISSMLDKIEQIKRGDETLPRRQTKFVDESVKLSGGKSGYWTRPTELFARAFESWVFDTLKARNVNSPYLVNGVEEDRFASGYKGNPYPVGSERQEINLAISRVMEEMTPHIRKAYESENANAPRL